ncbi:MAG: hypothetical protein JSW11_01535 [Candidatus Heimdallarchaeota archaeon]|nr:MAG: hypothetical protein JSW11_01535 [Candidatus Heimdallarchaeota archaeon]
MEPIDLSSSRDKISFDTNSLKQLSYKDWIFLWFTGHSLSNESKEHIRDIFLLGISSRIELFLSDYAYAIIFTFITAFLLLNMDALINWLPEDMFDLIKGAKTMAFLVFGGLAVLFWLITIYNLKKSQRS